MTGNTISVRPYGNRAILIEFDQRISLELNQSVQRLCQLLAKLNLSAIQNLLPAFCSLTVLFDPDAIEVLELERIIRRIVEVDLQASTANATVAVCNNETKDSNAGNKILIPVCYEEPFALDWKDVEQNTGLSVDEIIERHTGCEYQVFMVGFLPGFAYLGAVDESIRCPRRDQPRLHVPLGSVGIADGQTGVYPLDAPGGWQIIGRTPISMFGTESQPFLLKPGDTVEFESIDRSAFEEIQQRNRGEG
ncbi:MAG: 5-oxoprolinase subunit PxpB [Planctomycetota bacterium]